MLTICLIFFISISLPRGELEKNLMMVRKKERKKEAGKEDKNSYQKRYKKPTEKKTYKSHCVSEQLVFF